MKKILYILLVGSLTFTACTDFLEENPYGKQSSNNFFSQKEDLAASLNALYSVVATSQAQNNYVGTNFLAEAVYCYRGVSIYHLLRRLCRGP